MVVEDVCLYDLPDELRDEPLRNLLRDVDPVSGSSHHSLSIDGSKSKVVADFQTGCVGHPVISSQYVRIRGVGNQVLDISPCHIRTGYRRLNPTS